MMRKLILGVVPNDNPNADSRSIVIAFDDAVLHVEACMKWASVEFLFQSLIPEGEHLVSYKLLPRA